MRIAIRTNDEKRTELTHSGTESGTDIIWVSAFDELLAQNADAYMDLLFEEDAHRVQQLAGLYPRPVIINSVLFTLEELNANVVRINAWPTFLQPALVEAAANDADLKKHTEAIFRLFRKTVEWVPDILGFVTPRVVSMIINEAWFALEEKISTKEEIDTAMKLGTNYPYGPFEWAERIGAHRVAALLSRLSATQSRYEPSQLLVKAANR